MPITKKSINLMNNVKQSLNSSLNDLDPTKIKELDEALTAFEENIQEMENEVLLDIKYSNLTDETKAYLVRFLKNPNSQIEDLLDLKLEVKKDDSTDIKTTKLEVRGDETIGSDVDKS